jgi:hypothetical protein
MSRLRERYQGWRRGSDLLPLSYSLKAADGMSISVGYVPPLLCKRCGRPYILETGRLQAVVFLGR